MFAYYANHYAQPGEEDLVRSYLRARAEQQAAQPGFVKRYTLVDENDASNISTFTIWKSREEWDTYIKNLTPDKDPTFTHAHVEYARYESWSLDVLADDDPKAGLDAIAD